MSTIRVILKKNKKGISELYLSVSVKGHQSLKKIDFNVEPSSWNPRKEIVVGKNAEAINKLLFDFKSSVASAEFKLKSENKPYNSKTLLNFAFKPTSSTYYGYMEDYCSSLGRSTCDNHRAAYKHLKTLLGNDFLPSAVDDRILIRLVSKLRDSGHLDSGIKCYLQCISAILNFAKVPNPIDRYFCSRILHLKIDVKHLAVDSSITTALFSWWVERMFNVDLSKNEMFLKNEDSLRQRHVTEEMAVGTFLSSFIMQGLAPIDLAKLKAGDIISTNECYKCSIFRQKTGKAVEIVVPKTTENSAVIEPFLSTSKDYIFPIVYNGKFAAPTLAQFSKRAKILLNKVLDDIGIQHSPISLYAARHSYASRLAFTGIGAGLIATAMGRDISNIERYIKSLSTSDDLLLANKNIKF